MRFYAFSCVSICKDGNDRFTYEKRRFRGENACGSRTRLSVFEKRCDGCGLQSLSAFEEFQLNQKLRLEQIRTGVADKYRRGGRSSTSREQIIHQYNPLAFSQGVCVHFHFCLAVLQ